MKPLSAIPALLPLLAALTCFAAAKDGCEKYAPTDSIVMDYFHDGEITRNRAYYKDGVITRLQGFKNVKQVDFEKYYTANTVDSVLYFDDLGRVERKVRFKYTDRRREMLGKRFNTHEDISSRNIGVTDDVMVRTVEINAYGAKSMEIVFENETMARIVVHSYKGPKTFSKPEAMDSILRSTYVPRLEEDLTGRPASEILSFIKSRREIMDLVNTCLSRFQAYRGQIVVEFQVLKDGSVPGVMILESRVPCKNIGIQLMNVIKNMTFPANPKYGTATVTYPFQF